MTWKRADHLKRLLDEQPFDVLVVGGGIVGGGTALDLAARGLKVALVERGDFAQGTSSRSTKLFHGGIRYLPQIRFGLVGEALREQKVLAEVAGFLYRPLDFIIPLYRQYGLADAPRWAARGWRAPIALRAGLSLYDLLGGRDRPGERHQRLSLPDLHALIPTLHSDGLKGGFAYSDAQTDDSRLVITILKTAVVDHGAVAVNQVRAVGAGRSGGRFVVIVVDEPSGEHVAIRSGALVAATGAFPAPHAQGGDVLPIVTSKGSHLLFDPDALRIGEVALVLPETDDGRVLYIIPWLGRALLGTTDTPYNGDLSHPSASVEDVEYLLRHLQRFLDTGPVEPLSTFAGLRALADHGASSTAEASREHEVVQVVPGYLQVAGGKLTTYRRIAQEVADRVARFLRIKVRSGTEHVALLGSGDPEGLERRLGRAALPPPAVAAALSGLGTEAAKIARLAETHPELGAVLGDGETTLASVVHGARHESANTLGDIALRRSHLAWFTKDHGRSDGPAMATVLAAELGWSSAERAQQLQAFEEELEAEGL